MLTKEELFKRAVCDICHLGPDYPSHQKFDWINHHEFSNPFIAHIREQDKAIAEARELCKRYAPLERNGGSHANWLKRYGEGKCRS